MEEQKEEAVKAVRTFKFIKTPQKGQLVKVYSHNRQSYRVGVVIGLVMREVPTAMPDTIKIREMVALRETHKRVPYHQYDFFFDDAVVVFFTANN
jgi:hypothetical protein